MFLLAFLWYSASEWKVPTTFIYGHQDWMNYQGAQEARKQMKVPCEIIRVPQVALSPFLPGYSDQYHIILSPTAKTKCNFEFLAITTAGWTLCFYRQPCCFSFSCVLWLSQVFPTRPGQQYSPRRSAICLDEERGFLP